jgi:hypothetical protein
MRSSLPETLYIALVDIRLISPMNNSLKRKELRPGGLVPDRTLYMLYQRRDSVIDKRRFTHRPSFFTPIRYYPIKLRVRT